jgi:hypothetical protein
MPGAKLTGEQVTFIRHCLADGVWPIDLARLYDVRSSTISKIAHGQSWCTVAGPITLPGYGGYAAHPEQAACDGRRGGLKRAENARRG